MKAKAAVLHLEIQYILYVFKNDMTRQDTTHLNHFKELVSAICATSKIGPLTENTWSSAIMHKIHPSLKANSSFPPQFHCGVPQCTGRSLIVRHTFLLTGEK